MTEYVLIESRDPFDSNDVDQFCGLARDLRAHGDRVTLFLAQNGVLPARNGARSEHLRDLVGAGIDVLADAFALAERGIRSNQLVPGVRPAELDVVVDRMADGCKTIWH